MNRNSKHVSRNVHYRTWTKGQWTNWTGQGNWPESHLSWIRHIVRLHTNVQKAGPEQARIQRGMRLTSVATHRQIAWRSFKHVCKLVFGVLVSVKHTSMLTMILTIRKTSCGITINERKGNFIMVVASPAKFVGTCFAIMVSSSDINRTSLPGRSVFCR